MSRSPEGRDRVLHFVNAVRVARSLPPLSRIEISGATRFDPARCILGQAMDCLIDNVVMHFRSPAEAQAVARATGMARVDPVSVVMPPFVAAVGVAFDAGMLGPALSLGEWESIRRETFLPLARRINEFTETDFMEAINAIRSARGMEPRVRLSLGGASTGGGHVLSRELACIVFERNLVNLLAWVEMRFADKDEAAQVARAVGEERYEPARDVSLPTPLAVLYATLEVEASGSLHTDYSPIDSERERIARRFAGYRRAQQAMARRDSDQVDRLQIAA